MGTTTLAFLAVPLCSVSPVRQRQNVGAIISGYRAVQSPVYEGRAETTLTYSYNTGIIVAYRIETAIALIRENPMGFLQVP